MAEGRSNKAIASALGVSPATVETHRAHVLEKLDLHSVAEVCTVRRAARHHHVTDTGSAPDHPARGRRWSLHMERQVSKPSAT